jgi:hypothetical protein
VEAGGDPDRHEIGHPLGQPAYECVAQRPVPRPHPAQVAIELASRDEVGEGQLVEHR